MENANYRLPISKFIRSTKFATLGSFGYQSVVSLAMFMAISWILPAKEYSGFSVLYATSQFASIGCFEWVRLAISRYYPGISIFSEPIQRRAVQMEYIGSLCVGSLLACLTLFWFNLHSVIVVMLVATFQGASDLILTSLRFKGDFRKFSKIQTTRATLSAFFSIASAKFTHNSISVLISIATALLVTATIAILNDPQLRIAPKSPQAVSQLRPHALYGYPAAIAASMNLAVILAIRYSIPITGSPKDVPGALLALDLMQRPFNIILTALHSILYPAVIKGFDSGDGKRAYRELILIEGASIFTMFIIVSSLLPLIAEHTVSSQLRPGFTLASAICLPLFGIRSIFINISYLKFHLYKKSILIMIISIFDLIINAIFLYLCRINGNVSINSMLFGTLIISTILMILTFLLSAPYKLASSAPANS